MRAAWTYSQVVVVVARVNDCIVELTGVGHDGFYKIRSQHRARPCGYVGTGRCSYNAHTIPHLFHMYRPIEKTS